MSSRSDWLAPDAIVTVCGSTVPTRSRTPTTYELVPVIRISAASSATRTPPSSKLSSSPVGIVASGRISQRPESGVETSAFASVNSKSR
jgi:hypothetical protein